MSMSRVTTSLPACRPQEQAERAHTLGVMLSYQIKFPCLYRERQSGRIRDIKSYLPAVCGECAVQERQAAANGEPKRKKLLNELMYDFDKKSKQNIRAIYYFVGSNSSGLSKFFSSLLSLSFRLVCTFLFVLTKEIPSLSLILLFPSAMHLHLHTFVCICILTLDRSRAARPFAPISTFLKRNIYQINTLEDYLNVREMQSSRERIT